MAKSSPAPLSTASKKLIEKGRALLTKNYAPREMVLDHGKGAKLYDLDGNSYIDFGAGIAVCALGYGDKDMLNAIRDQSKKLMHTSNVFFTEPGIKLADELIKASKFAERVFFSNSGGEANEAAIKLARKWAADQGRPAEKRVILTFEGSFHGRTLATVTATAQPKYHAGFEPLPGGFDYLPWNDEAALAARMAKGDVCAVMLEVVQGEGGVVPATDSFLKKAHALCQKHHALLMFDQVQCGMGRTGHLFSHFAVPGVTPDVVSLAKALGGGFPIGACLVGPKVAETFQLGSHGSTYGGNPLATACARVVLKKLQSKELQQNTAERSAQLMAALRQIGEEMRLFTEVRGRGLMIGAELVPAHHGKAGAISEACRKAGVIVLVAGPNVLRFVPPLVITEKEVASGIKRLRKALKTYLAA